MKSLFYVEEDFVAGLLKDYFVVGSGDSAHFIRRASNGLADRLSKDGVDLFLAAVVAIGTRVFLNLSLIRRYYLTKAALGKRKEQA